VFLAKVGAAPCYHNDVRNFLNVRFTARCIGRRGRAEGPSRSPDLTPVDLYSWGNVKNAVCAKKQRTLQDLGREIELPVKALHHIQYKKCATSFHFGVSSAPALMVNI
jgi:hypothetical protein